MTTYCHIHLISDATGETLDIMVRAVLSQFSDVHPMLHISSMVRTANHLEEVLLKVENTPGIVIYTITSKELRKRLEYRCRELNVEILPALKPLYKLFKNYLHILPAEIPAAQHALNDEYYKRIKAVDFTMAHDDGNSLWDIEEADIIIFGISRTSKTPTCMYLANRGYSVANIPLIEEQPIDEKYFKIKGPVKIGLTIRPDRLIEIRKSRLYNLDQQTENFNYTDMEKIRAELIYSKKLFAKYHIKTIDVTRKSVEETSGKILSIYSEERE